ncbi:YfiM family lipoprotein [Kluyvera sp. CRP]|uniref:YfiM family lipoprotein n=1 Tax=Kluyvera sp. CRP TaxID=2873269 RepID=UPI001CC1CCC5|nr:YfiM family lipoprotein [Kluyvera sp. CRP]UAK20211.1 YfiM family lipoprotein [Kluyvera sp. CRP]
MLRPLLMCTMLALSGCSHMANDSWSGQDKAQHFIASAMLSAAGNEYAQHQGLSRDRSAAVGLMFSVSLGASKELWDSRPAGSGWSWKDLAWDVAGATTGYAVWQLAQH